MYFDVSILILITVAIPLVLFLYPISLAVRSWLFFRGPPRWANGSYSPSVALIVPCKGLEQGFEANVNAILSQDYPDYRAIFVTATEDDPAHAVLRRLIAHAPRATLLTAGTSERRAQKINNMLRGIAAAGGVEVLAFVDSDARPHSNWLRSLVAPLADPQVGASTGSPWYRPERGGLWSWARAYVTNLSVLFMAHTRNRGLWGGAMAIRRETFDRARVAEGWEEAVSDDSVMSQRVRSLGLRLAFVPDCLTTSVEDCNLVGFYEFVKRHLVLLRICEPPLWQLVGAALAVLATLSLAGAAAVALGPLLPWLLLLGAILLLQVPLIGGFGGLVLLVVFGDSRTSQWAVLTPLVFGVLIIAFAASALTRRIRWRGVSYELLSSERTVVLGQMPDLRLSTSGYSRLRLQFVLTLGHIRCHILTRNLASVIRLVFHHIRQGGWRSG